MLAKPTFRWNIDRGNFHNAAAKWQLRHRLGNTMRNHCKATSKAAQLLLVAVAAAVASQSGIAQPGDAGTAGVAERATNAARASDAGLPAGDAAATSEAPSDAALADDTALFGEDAYEGIDELDEADLPPGLQPLASYVVEDEITVRGLRPGDIRKRLWDIDIEIEKTTLAFFRLLNEVIVDDQFHVQCVRPQRQRNAQGRLSSAIIIERRCYAGYQVDAMSYDSSPTWLMEKEREYTEIVMSAIAEIPSLAVAAEGLTSMQEERRALTGDDPALSGEQYRRQLVRDEFLGPFEALERRRQRKAEREEEREAKRQSERP